MKFVIKNEHNRRIVEDIEFFIDDLYNIDKSDERKRRAYRNAIVALRETLSDDQENHFSAVLERMFKIIDKERGNPYINAYSREELKAAMKKLF